MSFVVWNSKLAISLQYRLTIYVGISLRSFLHTYGDIHGKTHQHCGDYSDCGDIFESPDLFKGDLGEVPVNWSVEYTS